MTEWNGPFYYEEITLIKKAIGVDPDAQGYVCALVDTENSKPVYKRFSSSKKKLKGILDWINEIGDEVIIAIEGKQGYSTALEKLLKENNVTYYSFTSSTVDKFKKAVLGQHKSNEKDAEGTGLLALSQSQANRLGKYQQSFSVDSELRMISRAYESRTKELARSFNRLWKDLMSSCTDLFLFCYGNHPDFDFNKSLIESKGFLHLLSCKGISSWKEMSFEELYTIMNGGLFKDFKKIHQNIMKCSEILTNIPKAIQIELQLKAKNILHQLELKKETISLLKELALKRPAIFELQKIHGIGITTASIMISEIIDIRRFKNNNHLASYAGLTQKEHSSGPDKENRRMVYNYNFNKRLKNAFFTAAKNFVNNNPDSHLTGYFRNLIKKGMKVNEAYKRVARSLVRVIYRMLKALVGTEKNDVESAKDIPFDNGIESNNSTSQKNLNISFKKLKEENVEKKDENILNSA